jgi:KUP system potassium uptake protein
MSQSHQASLGDDRTGRGSSQAALTLAALGVVFGDIGTSPLYAFKEAFKGGSGLAVSPENVLAALSALLWAVVVVVAIKYVWVVLSYDNDGEGGVLALTALAHRALGDSTRRSRFVVGAGVFAAALFYGDAIITPAISVLSAVEGLSIATPNFEHFVVPVTIGILISLFSIQMKGTSRVGRLFGPITIVWFVCLAWAGVLSIMQTPMVLEAFNPLHALRFAVQHTDKAFFLLSSVFLAMTGAEALYADMGHFGSRAVRLGWFGLVFPSLMINYFGQGALVLRDAAAVGNPFFLLASPSFLLPFVVLATAATVIASQATISGAYSMTLQASRLGYLPRVRVLHTSDEEQGQIYVPSVNWLMLLSVIALVLAFKSSGALAAAYGIAVSGTMLITTMLVGFVVCLGQSRHKKLILAALAGFAVLEIGFVSSNLTKLEQGGWFPLTIGALIFIALTTWRDGTQLVAEHRSRLDIPMTELLVSPMTGVPVVSGTAVYLTSDPRLVPSALFHNLKHFKVMHEQTVFLHVVNENTPYVPDARRLQLNRLCNGVWTLNMHFGFREQPNIPAALKLIRADGEGDIPDLDPMATSFFVARVQVVDGPGGLSRWRCAIFGWMTRQAASVSSYYMLPANRVVELGTQVVL